MERAHTPKEIEVAYRTAKKIANQFIRSRKRLPDMDFDDFVQEGVLGWLEGRNIYYAMASAYRYASKFHDYDYRVKGITDPVMVEFNEETHTEADCLEESVVQALDAGRIIERILEIEDDTVQFILLGAHYFGMSLRELSVVLGKSHEWVRTILVEQTKILREEFQA